MSESKRTSADRDHLLAEAYHADWDCGAPSLLATNAARTVRRRHAIRQTLTTASALALLTSSAWWFSHHPTRPAPTPAPAYEIISDAELLSYLHDQRVLILTSADRPKQVIWLDTLEPNEL